MSHRRLRSFLPHVRTGAGGCVLQLEAQGEVRVPSPQGGAAGGLVPSLACCQMGPGMARTKGVRHEAVKELPLLVVSLSQHPPLWATSWHNLLLGLPGAS